MPAEPTWTPEDVARVVKALHKVPTGRWSAVPIAEAALAALAEAGRLLPAGAREYTEWDVDWLKPSGNVIPMRYEGKSDEYMAEEFSAAKELGSTPERIQRRDVRAWPDGSRWVGSWQPVNTPKQPT